MKLTKAKLIEVARLGGYALAAQLTKEQRIERARNAARARWKKQRLRTYKANAKVCEDTREPV